MASDKDQSEERQKQASQQKLREAVGDAYAALQGQAAIQSFVAYTFEEAVSDQIDRISGTTSRLRPNELDRVKAVSQNLMQAVQATKKLPPSAFLTPDPQRDVNT